MLPDRPGRPVLFVGWDGADWQLLDLYLKDGAMPNLAALVREGRSGVLLTIQPPLSPLVWTTMMTGVSPLVHGILDFTRFHPGSGEREPITRAERRVPALWNMAGMAGRSSAVFGLWATWPAEPVDGLLVSDRLFSFQSPEATPPPGVVYPPAEEAWARDTLAKTEREVGFTAVHAYLPWLTAAAYQHLLAQPDPYAQPAAALRRILVETAVYDRLATGWLARHRPDLTVVYFQGSDAIGHVFAPYAPPRQPAVSAEDYARYSGVPRAYFADLDRRLGGYRQARRGEGRRPPARLGPRFPLGGGAARAPGERRRGHRRALAPRGGDLPALGTRNRAPARGRRRACRARQRHPGRSDPPRPPRPPPRRGALRAAARRHPALESGGVAGPLRRLLPARTPGSRRPTLRGLGGDRQAQVAGLCGVRRAGPRSDAPAAPGTPDATRTAGSFDNEGLLLRAAGRTAEARAAFERALARDPANAAALANLSDLLAQGTPSSDRDRDRADALLVQALAAGLPDGVERVLARVAADRRAGAAERGLGLLDRTIAALPERPEPRLLRGRLRLERQDCRGALADFSVAATARPENALAWGSAALARLCLGDRAGAVRDLRRSLALDPHQPEIARALAQIAAP